MKIKTLMNNLTLGYNARPCLKENEALIIRYHKSPKCIENVKYTAKFVRNIHCKK